MSPTQRAETFGTFRRLWSRRWVRVGAVGLAIVAPLGGAGGTAGWTYIKTDPEFCVKCHIMNEPGEKWAKSAHKDIACQTCHRADIFEEARMGYAAFIERRTEIGPHTKMPVSICLECHAAKDPRWEKQVVQTPGHRAHFALRDVSCLECHATRLHEFAADTDSCLRCHGQGHLRLEKMEKLHCLGCHDFLGESAATLVPKADRCRDCHAPDPGVKPPIVLASADPGLAGPAAPVSRGHEDCLGCHRPHGEKLRDPVDCLSCHAGVLAATSAHYKDERLESCRECHEPHERQAK